MRAAAFTNTILLCGLLLGQLGCDDKSDSARDAGPDAGDRGKSAGRGGGGAGKSAGAAGKRAGTAGVAEAGGGSVAGNASVAGHAGAGGERPTVTLRFKAQVGDEAFACGKIYDNLGISKRSATPKDLRFLVQDIQLITRDGKEVPFEIAARTPYQLPEVAMLDFSDGEGECAGDSAINAEVTGVAAPGDYDGIAFSIGVPDSINHQNIALAAPPLQDASLYWGWQNGYRFLLAELLAVGGPAADTGSDDAGVGSGSSLIHTGSGGCAGSNSQGFTCSRPNRSRVRITGFDPTKRAIVADVAEVFEQVDLDLGLQCHGAAPGCAAIFSALGLDFENGQPLSTQRVFRAE